jgi:RNA polymerase sigma-B factor
MELSQGSATVEAIIDPAARQTQPSLNGPARTDVIGCEVSDVEGERSAVNGLIARVQRDGDTRALAALMAQFDWVALQCARRMHRRGESIEDLEQVAREGMLAAVSRFDVHRGVAFKTFAWSTAMGMLRHHYRSRWQVRVPRGLQELNLATMRAIEELSARAGRPPTIEELAEHLRVDRDDVLVAIDAGHAYRASSLEALSDDGCRTVQHKQALAEVDNAIEMIADRVGVRELLGCLPVRQREILVMRFVEGRTQSEIGDSLGISQVHVSRLIRAALGILRDRTSAA